MVAGQAATVTTIEVDEDEQGPWTVLSIRGNWTWSPPPHTPTRPRRGRGGRHDLVIDLSAVRFCDSSGVGVLIAARRLLRSCGGRLRLILPEAGIDGGDGHVDRVLSALGVRRLFDVYGDVPAAVTGSGRTAP